MVRSNPVVLIGSRLEVHDWIHVPAALLLLGRKWYWLFRMRTVRCRLDGPMAVTGLLAARDRTGVFR